MRISDWSSDVCSSDLLPLHSIEPLRQPAAAARTLAQMRNADAWIFTSVNAVAHAQRLDAGVWPRTIAVGAATAAALRRPDHEVELPDGAYTSEGVLALSELQSVAGRRYAIVTRSEEHTSELQSLMRIPYAG